MRQTLLLLLYSLFSLPILAQTVTGTVKDVDGQPLASATVAVRGTNIAVQTNDQGQFSIQADRGTTLETTLVGFEKQVVVVQGQSAIEIVLTETLSSLDEVVIIGYQSVSKKKNTAAISSISGKELANIPAASFDMLLQGRLAGVNVQNFTGMPGGAPTVNVRGTTGVSSNYEPGTILNNPLYVVDGVPQPAEQYNSVNTGTGTNYLAGLNPNDIESVDVLRDASAAAIYGSRAANGVIMITTKKGRSTEPTVMVNGYTGIVMRPELRDVTLGAAERRQKMEIIERQVAYNNRANLPFLLTDSLNPAFNGNTNWQDLFYQLGKINNGDLSLSGGGSGGMSYRFSAGYYDEEGIIKATGFKRFSSRLNLVSRAAKEKLMINPIIAFTRTDRARGNGEGLSPLERNLGLGISPLNVGAGNMPSSLINLSDSKRELILGVYDENLDKNINNQLALTLNLDYAFSPHLRFTSQTSYTNNGARRDYNRPSALNGNVGNLAFTFSSAQENWLSSNYLTYNNMIGKHSLSALLGQDIQTDRYQTTQAWGNLGSSDQIKVVQGFLQNNIGAGSDYQAWGLLSYYARFSYDFDSRYLFSGSLRSDGSSRFGEDSKWGWFPAFSVGWLLSEEDFLKDSEGISMLKIRGSYGTSGSLPRENYLQYNLYNVNAGSYSGSGATSYNGVVSTLPNFHNGVAQRGLTWEKSRSWNIGADIDLFQGKYSFSADIYNRETTAQLFSVELPVTTGYDLALTNSIGIRNAGFEVIINANPLNRTSPVRWMTNFNLSYNRNAIMNLPNGGRDLVLSGDRFDKSHILSVGSPINTFYLLQTLGVYGSRADVPINPYTGERFRNNNGLYDAGDFYFADLDGDYFIDVFNSGINPDKLPIGDPNPKWTGGWTNTFSYRNFSLTVFLNYTLDRDVLNLFESDAFSNSTAGSAMSNFAYFSIPDLSKYNIWRADGDEATYAKMDLGSYRYYYTSAQTFFLESGSYVRLKNIIGSYEVNQAFLSRMGLGRLRIYGIVDNAYMWQKSRKLPDAEAVNQYGEYNGGGYPIPRKYTLGLELTF
ncbi:SusC/RagA family TonB-linked outer membrane protein [Parapedobacter deserti]|uniref:SusC/RagA family TonB-linked outer membrane protein n=1 Tax=Parapedobacter deserti TaxID=1912957 RepID=A0ABV7JP72_9SPHI